MWTRDRLKVLLVFLSVLDSLRRRSRNGLEILFMFLSVLNRLRRWARNRLEVLFVLMVPRRSSLRNRLCTLLVAGSEIVRLCRSWNRNRSRWSRGGTRLISTNWWRRRSVVVRSRSALNNRLCVRSLLWHMSSIAGRWRRVILVLIRCWTSLVSRLTAWCLWCLRCWIIDRGTVGLRVRFYRCRWYRPRATWNWS